MHMLYKVVDNNKVDDNLIVPVPSLWEWSFAVYKCIQSIFNPSGIIVEQDLFSILYAWLFIA